jgi:hypothetical protein
VIDADAKGKDGQTLDADAAALDADAQP